MLPSVSVEVILFYLLGTLLSVSDCYSNLILSLIIILKCFSLRSCLLDRHLQSVDPEPWKSKFWTWPNLCGCIPWLGRSGGR